MPNAKKYILTGVILGSIAAVAGGLIAATNLITESKIKQNEIDKVNAGIVKIFGDEAVVKSEDDLDSYNYVVHYYEVSNTKNEFLGYAFKSEGSNMYGKISLIAGFDATSHNFMSLYLVTNEQTYASTLVDKYITPLNNNEKGLDDVNCGATYGAKLVRDLVNDANKAAEDFWKK